MCFCCRFMVLKKLVVLYLCGLIQDDNQANLLFVTFDDLWQWWNLARCVGFGIQWRNMWQWSKKTPCWRAMYLVFYKNIRFEERSWWFSFYRLHGENVHMYRYVIVLDSKTFPLCTRVYRLKLCRTTTWIKMCVACGSDEKSP